MLLWRALAWSSSKGVLGAFVLVRVMVRLILGFKPDASGGVLRGRSVDIFIAFVLGFSKIGILRRRQCL